MGLLFFCQYWDLKHYLKFVTLWGLLIYSELWYLFQVFTFIGANLYESWGRSFFHLLFHSIDRFVSWNLLHIQIPVCFMLSSFFSPKWSQHLCNPSIISSGLADISLSISDRYTRYGEELLSVVDFHPVSVVLIY